MTREELLESFRKSKERVLACFDLGGAAMTKSYAPGKWCVREIIIHLADVEMVYLWRLLRGLAERGSRVEAMNPDAWAEDLRYKERPLDLSRAMFAAARDEVLYFVETMKPEAFDYDIDHSERGLMRVGELLDYLAEHTGHHLEQIDAAIAGRVWTPPATE